MKVAVIGSDGIIVPNLQEFLPKECTEIISGGETSVEICAKEYAKAYKIKLTEFIPNYENHKKIAIFKRNFKIIKKSDFILAFWDEKSLETKHIIDNCKKTGKPMKIILAINL